MTFSYSDNLIRCASDGLQKPSDFGYWGPKDMFKTWGFCGIDKNRGSSILDISNFDYISKELMEEFPDDFRIENYNHWAVGSETRLVCRILHHKGIVEDKNITDAFRKAMKWLDDLADYLIADESDYFDKQHLRRIQDLPYLDVVKMINQTDTNWAADIIYQMETNGDYWDAETESPDDNQLLMAAYELRLWNAEYHQEWFDWADKNKVPRPPFDLESTSYWNKNQERLFN